MPEKITTFGAKFYKTSIALANEISNIVSLGGFDFTRPDIDTSTHSDTWKTFLAGQWDGGDFPMKLAFDPQDADHAALWTYDVDASVPTVAQSVFVATVPSKADGSKKTSITFTGYVKSFNQEPHEIDGMIVMNVVFKISGKPTFDFDESTVPA